jgi:ssDNA-binding Zn-finger/Zn-ribbon topoisomerase 1
LVDVHGDRYEYELRLTYNKLEKLMEFQLLEAMFLLKRMRRLDYLKQCPECREWSWMRRRCDRYCPECEAKRAQHQ